MASRCHSSKRQRILAINPETDTEPHFEDYTVDADPMDRLLDCLHKVKWYQDSSLALRRSCAHGICGSDAMVINGENTLACKVLVKDLKQPITVEPIRGLPVIKDLIVDMEPFFAGYKAVKPWLITDADENGARAASASSPRRTASASTTRPSASCAPPARPRARSSGPTRSTSGPAAIVNAHRFIFDSRDSGAGSGSRSCPRKGGAFKCRTVFNCTEACPAGSR